MYHDAIGAAERMSLCFCGEARAEMLALSYGDVPRHALRDCATSGRTHVYIDGPRDARKRAHTNHITISGVAHLDAVARLGQLRLRG